MTDPGTADRTYIGPMTPELVEEIIANVSHYCLAWYEPQKAQGSCPGDDPLN